jgi:hypothetical protein
VAVPESPEVPITPRRASTHTATATVPPRPSPMRSDTVVTQPPVMVPDTAPTPVVPDEALPTPSSKLPLAASLAVALLVALVAVWVVLGADRERPAFPEPQVTVQPMVPLVPALPATVDDVLAPIPEAPAPPTPAVAPLPKAADTNATDAAHTRLKRRLVVLKAWGSNLQAPYKGLVLEQLAAAENRRVAIELAAPGNAAVQYNGLFKQVNGLAEEVASDVGRPLPR